MQVIRTKIEKGGRVTIPPSVCKKLHVVAGDEVVLEIRDKDVRLTTPEDMLRNLQETVSRKVKPGYSLADELIKERREEAIREEAENE